MRYLRFVLPSLLAVALVLAACGSDGAGDLTPTGTVSGSPTPTATVPPPATATPDNTVLPTEAASLPETLLQLLREDLVRSLIINPIDMPDSIEVVGVEAVASPDDCIEYGNPTVACPPVEFTPGYRVTLRRLDFGVEYIYYTDGEDSFAGPWQIGLPSPGPVSPDALPPPLLELLREDLARRLGVTPESIEVALVEEAVWPGCFGLSVPCPSLDFILGYRVTLSAAGGEHRYRTDREVDFRYVGPVDAQ